MHEVMETPLELVLLGAPPSPGIETQIRGAVGELEGLFAEVVSCRVQLELPPERKPDPRLYRLVIELGIPGRRLVVTRAPDDNGAHEELESTIRDGFASMRRQLDDHLRLFHGDTDEGFRPPV